MGRPKKNTDNCENVNEETAVAQDYKSSIAYTEGTEQNGQEKVEATNQEELPEEKEAEEEKVEAVVVTKEEPQKHSKEKEETKYVVLHKKNNVGSFSITCKNKSVNMNNYNVVITTKEFYDNNCFLKSRFTLVGDSSNFMINTKIKQPCVLSFKSGVGSFAFKCNNKTINSIQCGLGLVVDKSDYNCNDNFLLRTRTVLLGSDKDVLFID